VETTDGGALRTSARVTTYARPAIDPYRGCNAVLQTVPIAPLAPDRFRTVLTDEQAAAFEAVIAEGQGAFAGRVIWNVNSTAHGGGVAEMLRSLIAYARGAAVDARWLVIEGNPEFFEITKRVHNRLHGADGDGGELGERERAIYAAVADANAHELAGLVAPGDLVLLHDPQTAGLARRVLAAGAHVVWRCHVGLDEPNELTRSAWDFLLPHVTPADAYVFSRQAFEWEGLDESRIAVIPPSIDAFSPKNQNMTRAAVTAILHVAGLADHDGHGQARFLRQDGTPARVDRPAVLWEASPLRADAPLVLQVSRWDRLKDPLGVIQGFARHVAPATRAHLLLAGPDVSAVADDPEGVAVLSECVAHWEGLTPDVKARVHLAALPMDDAEENAAIVNALQRRAQVVVQKSIAEGFGLTVAEAMWKGSPVVASRIGGIQDQIVDGESGRLVDPRDLAAFGQAVVELLTDRARARRIGATGQLRVRDMFLGPRHLGQYLELFKRVMRATEPELTRR
jgi:trehalose synthase